MLLTLLQFFATKFLFLALHLESGSFPKPLSAREEQAAFAALRAGDAAAREKLIRHNLRWCIENAVFSPAHFEMEKRTHPFHAATHLRQNGFFGAERAVPFSASEGVM